MVLGFEEYLKDEQMPIGPIGFLPPTSKNASSVPVERADHGNKRLQHLCDD